VIRGRYNPPRNVDASASLDQPVLRDFPDPRSTSPADWLRGTVEQLREPGEHAVFVLLTGSADLVGFRLRVAQSHARADMLPSCFDHAALVCVERDEVAAYHVPLRHLSASACARTNGIRRERALEIFAPRWGHTPNLALLRFPVDSPREVETAAQDLVHSRLSDDFLTPLSSWLAFVWGVRGSGNPLLDSVSIPAAAFVETCFATARQDVTPGVTTRVVTPESIWQARFWPDRYQEPPTAAGAGEPAAWTIRRLGYYVLQQPAAAVAWPRADRERSVKGTPA
jgi:hypothetical protein